MNENEQIRVWNLHEDGWAGRPGPAGRGDYIGRPTILGNPWVVGKDGPRERVVERYRQWLWTVVKEGIGGAYGPAAPDTPAPILGRWGWEGREQEPAIRAAVWWAVAALARRARARETLDLVCYCRPLLCHGDVLKNCLEYLVSVQASALERRGIVYDSI
jgi:hypothetical protein